MFYFVCCIYVQKTIFILKLLFNRDYSMYNHTKLMLQVNPWGDLARNWTTLFCLYSLSRRLRSSMSSTALCWELLILHPSHAQDHSTLLYLRLTFSGLPGSYRSSFSEWYPHFPLCSPPPPTSTWASSCLHRWRAPVPDRQWRSPAFSSVCPVKPGHGYH